MRKIAKHALMLLLCITVLCCTLPSTVSAVETATGECGETATYSYDGMGTLTISGTGAISSSPYDDQYVSDYEITTVVIQSGITSIGDSVFANLHNLTGITIADTVTTIGNYAFSNCWGLTDITIPDRVTSIGEGAFYNCKNLSGITVGSSVASIGKSAFFQCASLTDITIPGSVTSIGNNAFEDCGSLTSITIPDSVTSIGCYTFSGCDSLTSITIGNGITGIGEGVFEFCTSLSSVIIGDSVTSVGASAFHSCSSLTSLSIPNGVTSIGEGAFSLCSGLTHITIPDTVTSIGYDAFSGCERLTDITIPDGITSIGLDVFSGCKSLTSITIPDSVVSIGGGAFSCCDSLDSIFFMGDGLELGINALYNVTATAYYPCENGTWTEALMQNYGGTITWVPINYQMDVPAIHVSSRASDGKPVVRWDAVDGAAKYRVYRAESENGEYKLMKTVTGSTSYTNTSAKAGTTYYYYVVAVADDGTVSEASNVVSRICKLARPVVTGSNVASTGKVKLTWKAVDGAEKYRVYRAESKNGAYKLMKTVTTGTSYTNTSAVAGKTYYYKVVAVCADEEANSAASAIVTRTCDCARPVVTASNVASNGKVKLTWKAVDGAVKYKVYRAASRNGEYRLMKTVTTGTSYTNTSAKAGVTYYYKVVAVGAKSASASAASAVVARTCDLARPDVSISRSSSGKPRLTWDAVDGAVEYKVYRATSKNGTYSLVKTTKSTSFTNTAAVSGRTYYYKVVAVYSNTAANSAASAVVSIKSR